MFENVIAAVLTVICTAKSISFGVWTIRRKNIHGGIATIILSLSAASLMGTYFISLLK